MKRAILPALMIALLCACSSAEKQEEEFDAWRQTLNAASAMALVTISQDGLAAEYELKCDWTPEESRVEVLAPEVIAGVTASRSGADTRLEYDGLILSLGQLGEISPVSALPALMDTIRTGYVELCYTEHAEDGDLLAVEFSPENGLIVRLWLDEDMVPVCADFSADGIAEIKITVSDWSTG